MQSGRGNDGNASFIKRRTLDPGPGFKHRTGYVLEEFSLLRTEIIHTNHINYLQILKADDYKVEFSNQIFLSLVAASSTASTVPGSSSHLRNKSGVMVNEWAASPLTP